jgi:hypothetical protein
MESLEEVLRALDLRNVSRSELSAMIGKPGGSVTYEMLSRMGAYFQEPTLQSREKLRVPLSPAPRTQATVRLTESE